MVLFLFYIVKDKLVEFRNLYALQPPKHEIYVDDMLKGCKKT